MNYQRYALYVLATVVVASVLFFVLTKNNTTSLIETESPASSTASVNPQMVDVNFTIDGSAMNMSVPSNWTVLDLMNAMQATGGLTFTGTDNPSIGFFVESINGKKSEPPYYWFLYVNGASSNTGASQTPLKQGDEIEWRYKQAD